MNVAAQYCHINSPVVNEAKTQPIMIGSKQNQTAYLSNIVAAT